MRLVWTKSKTPFSLLIRLVTGDDCSHFSFVFESAANGLMFESNLFGTHPLFYRTSLKTHTVMHEIIVPLTLDDENKIWDLIVDKYDDRPYDYFGVMYLGWRKLLLRMFKRPLPKHNKWAKPDAYFCNELYGILSCIPGMPNTDVGNGMETPHDLWKKLELINFSVKL